MASNSFYKAWVCMTYIYQDNITENYTAPSTANLHDGK